MDILTLVIILAVAALVLFVLTHTNESSPKFYPTLQSKYCKPHQWRYCDQDGWLPEDAEDERKKYARLVCFKCKTAPNSDTGTADY